MNKYITVLDYEDGEVYQYEIGVTAGHEEIEEFLTHSGHRLTNCEWMSHKSNNIIVEGVTCVPYPISQINN